ERHDGLVLEGRLLLGGGLFDQRLGSRRDLRGRARLRSTLAAGPPGAYTFHASIIPCRPARARTTRVPDLARRSARTRYSACLVLQDHPPERLRGAKPAPGALLPGPAADHRRRVPAAHLAPVLVRRADLEIEHAGDVHASVGPVRAGERHRP